MKKMISLLLSLIFCITLITPSISALETEYVEGKYTYTVSGGCAKIVSFPETVSGEVSIPSTLGGYKVTEIGAYAFYACTTLTKVTIPNTVVTIGNYAFAYCVELEYIKIPSSVTSIGNNAFHASNKIVISCKSGSVAAEYAEENGIDTDDIENSGDNESTKATITGTLEDYEVTTVVIINGGEGYDYVSRITVDGKNYKVEDEDLISETLAENLLENKVVVELVGSIVVSIKKYSAPPSDNPESSENDEPYHPTSYDPRIDCDDTSVEFYQNALLGGDWKTFKITGEITNYDEYHNLENIWITIKSPDGNIIKFNSDEKNEITFPLGRSIGTQKSSEFKCKAYINRDYMPTVGTDNLTLTCILNGDINGKRVEGVYTTFNVQATNLSYKEDKKWTNISLEEMLYYLFEGQDSNGVRYIDKYPGRAKYRFNNDALTLKSQYDVVKMATGVLSLGNLSEELYESMKIAVSFAPDTTISGVGVIIGEEVEGVLLDYLFAKINSEFASISEFRNSALKRMLDSEIFKDYLEWYSDEVGFVNGGKTKASLKCPIDIFVIDEFGDEVLRIIDYNVEVFDDSVSAYIANEEKILFLPIDNEYTIKILATDNGTMDYIVQTITGYNEPYSVTYNDVSLIKGKSYDAKLPSFTPNEIKKYNLFDDTGKAIKADSEQIDHTFGDKDATCLDCGYDRTEGCSCKCHKTNFFSKLIWKITIFFQKLFKKNQICSCGISHY